MPGHFGDRHHFAEMMDICCQSTGNPQIRVKKFQFLDTDAMAIGTEQLAICTAQPDLSTGQIKIPDGALSPTVNSRYFMTAQMADRVKALIGNNINKSFAGSLINHLLYNIYSTKGEIG